MTFHFKSPTFQEFISRGGNWKPDITWIVGCELEAFVQKLLEKYVGFIEAHELSSIVGIRLLELQISNKDAVRELEQQYVRFRSAKKPDVYIKKRLPKRRMYRLADTGQEFYYLGGLPHDMVRGKVLSENNRVADITISRTILEMAELIDDWQESWGISDDGQYRKK